MNSEDLRMKPTIFAALVFAVATAFAPIPAAAQGTAEQQANCSGDAMNFCGQYLSDVKATSACMRKNFKRLSPACRATMSTRTATRRHH
jgi:hypothetical protein